MNGKCKMEDGRGDYEMENVKWNMAKGTNSEKTIFHFPSYILHYRGYRASGTEDKSQNSSLRNL